MKTTKRFCFALVCLALMVFAGSALADGLTYLNENGVSQTCESYTVITADSTSLSSGWYAVTENVTINSRITVTGDVKLILTDNTTLTAPEGITVTRPSNDSPDSAADRLTIYAQSSGTNMGHLSIDRGGYGYNIAGLGGNDGYKPGGIITINGGYISVVSGQYSAGIGGSGGAHGGTITINGGNVTAYGNNEAAGIGGGWGNGSGRITINGGTVNATGGSGAGIGCANNYGGGQDCSITINGGRITASSSGSTGIGGEDCVVSLGWTNPNIDFIDNQGNYTGTVTFNKSFYLEGTETEATTENINVMKIIPWNRISVIFDSGKGSGTMSAVQFSEAQESYIIPACGFTPPAGASFKGWQQDNDTENLLSPGDSIAVNEAVRLTAIYAFPPFEYLDENGVRRTCDDYDTITADITTLTGGWYVVTENVTTTTEGYITISGDVKLILKDNVTLAVPYCIQVSAGNSLTIYAQSRDETSMGTLNAGVENSGAFACAGIGGSYGGTTGTIIINGGKINAYGGNGGGSGIGAGSYGCTPGQVVINEGIIYAVHSSSGGAGINGTSITINGGVIEGYGSYGCAGIGGKNGEDCGTITINGGSIYAVTYNYSCLGNGEGGSGGTININGGSIKTEPQNGAPVGIGGNGCTVTLGWTNPDSDYIDNLGSYIGTIAFADGKSFLLNETTTLATTENINGQKIVPIIVISFDANGGSGSMEDVMINTSSYTLPDCGFTPPSIQVFKGWQRDNDTENLLSPGDSIAVNGAVRLTAIYEYPSLTYLDEHGVGQTCDNYTPITADAITDDGLTLTTGWYAVTENVTINSRITVTGDVKLILTDNTTLTASKGISVWDGNSLTVYGQSTNAATMGSLIANASSESSCAGIGGEIRDGYHVVAGTVIINGGNVSATGGESAAGIGGGYSSGGTVTINGGIVHATGGEKGAGIGGGNFGDSGTITINGGTVTATGTDTAAGIGGGQSKGVGNIRITGGIVNATAGLNGGSGIGSGRWAGERDDGGPITIEGGQITVKANMVDEYAIGGWFCEVSLGWTNLDTDYIDSQCGYNSFENLTVTLNDLFFLDGTNTLADTDSVDSENISNKKIVPAVSVAYAANDGTGEMASQYLSAATASSYVLPVCGFTAPEGKVFKEWSVVTGSEAAVTKAPGDTITVTANTTVTAVWETLTAPVFTSAALELGGVLNLRYYVAYPAEWNTTDDKVVFTVNGVSRTVNYANSAVDTTGRYFPCPVNAFQMADRIDAVYYHGEEAVAQKENYTVKNNLDYLNRAYSGATQTLVRATMDFGSYIQPYLAAHNSWAVGTDHAAMTAFNTGLTALSSGDSEYNYQLVSKTADVNKALFSLSLEADTSINVLVQLKDGVTGTVSGTVNGTTVTPQLVTVENVGQAYKLSLRNIPSNALATAYTFTLSVTDGQEQTTQVFEISVSALSYVNLVLSRSTDNTEKLALTALYNYALAAKGE